MNRIIIVFSLTVFLLGCLTIPVSATDYDFRKTKWGMSKQQVLATETLELVSEREGSLTYMSAILHKKVLIGYSFVKNKLFRGTYLLREPHSNKNDFIEDYDDFKQMLTKKYGKPKKDNIVWRNNLFKNDFSQWGTAIGVGHLVYASEWETDSTKILCLLSGDNFKISLGVGYESKELKLLKKKQKEKRALDLF